MGEKIKTTKQIERHVKGIANHRRIEILMLIQKRKELSLEEIADELNGNLKTVSEHTRRLASAGLINKKPAGRLILHTLSPYGQIFYRFLNTFQHS